MKKSLAAFLFMASFATLPAHADITVGVIAGTTGPGASVGIPHKSTFSILPAKLGGENVRYVMLEDATDPSIAVKSARKLVTEDRVDVIIGSTSVPAATAMMDIATESKTPQIALCAMNFAPGKAQWVFSVPHPASIMIEAVVEHMKANGVKTVAYIGFSDPWGEVVYKNLMAMAEPAGITVLTNERYNRTDASVTAQVLKIVAANPDAVLVGGSGTPGALPQLALVERGYKKPIYHTHAVVNRDFLRVGGKSAERALAPTGPVMVAELLPDSNPIKNTALDFAGKYEKSFGAGSRSGFAAYTYDAYLLLEQAVPVALKKASPGTPEFRQALRDALENTKELVGSQAIYNMTPTDHYGVDRRSRVMVHVENGEWKPVK